jgi:hypothetical protein
VLCDTYSVSSSRAAVVTLVRVRERHGMLANRRSILTNVRCVWRLVKAALHPTPVTLPASGTDPLANPAVVSSIGGGVRHADLDTDLELLLLLPPSMRHVC